MEVAEIVEASDQIHAGHQRFGMLSYSASTTCQRVDALAKGRIEAFNKGGIDHTFALCDLDEIFHHVFRTLHNPSFDVQNAFNSLFDDLHDNNILPGNHPTPSRFPL